ncbi:uncharacterized protein A1O5_12677 [Cladophialophora psammophila CBS 110553]|uniref:Uncharacterized protein n=1 Tax=Cladophialophora psammophila CBS 110553 TaxID=1182543 RepID=W9VVI8_9EURO|nr:uncharacterized protein A1O5_12677 [Cladophialophora psammophila CBS 110553]EXJ56221.1 hypothetical protein A1O5_12677 [Cladophialophora psammophila CBS 110553]
MMTMSNRDICQADQFNPNEGFKVLDQDFAYFDTYPYDFLCDKPEQRLSDAVFDSFDIPPLPTTEWADYGTELANYPTEAAEDFILQAQPITERDIVNESPSREGELEKTLLRLQEKTEKLERELENIRNE